jgi:hypothetical protein
MVGNEEEGEGVDCRGSSRPRGWGGESHAGGKEGEGTPPPGGGAGGEREAMRERESKK